MVSTRAVASDVSPETLAFLRYLIGVCILGAPACASFRVRYAAGDVAAIAALGVMQFAVLIVLLNYALQALPAATCALIFSTMPLLTMAMAVTLGRETFGLNKLAGLLLAVCGIGLLLGASPSHGPARADAPWALAAVFGATVVGALCSILYRPYLRRYPVLPTSGMAMCAAVIFLLGLCWISAEPLVPRLNATQWGNVAFIGLSSGVGYFCWLWALGRIDASRVVAFQALGPITAAAIELVLERRLPSLALLFSIALVVVGLGLAMREKHAAGVSHGGRRAPDGAAGRSASE
jgi:drug/metabolite transporter (DMT)-like permease